MMRAELEEPTFGRGAATAEVRVPRERAAPAPPANATIRVTNVPKNLSTEDVQEAFEEIGRVLSCVVKKGVATISFATAAAAKKAVTAFDQGELNGETIRVEIEEPEKPVVVKARTEKAAAAPVATIRVSNVPLELTKKTVREAFEGIGKVTKCEVEQGVAIVTFANAAHAKEAIASFDRGELNNQTIYLAYAADESKSSQLLTSARAAAKTTIRVSNVPVELGKKDVKEAFEEIGKVVSCEVDRGVATIVFSKAADAKKAVQTFDRGELNGQMIFVATE